MDTIALLELNSDYTTQFLSVYLAISLSPERARGEFDNALLLIGINDIVYFVSVHEYIAEATSIANAMNTWIDWFDDAYHATPSTVVSATD